MKNNCKLVLFCLVLYMRTQKKMKMEGGRIKRKKKVKNTKENVLHPQMNNFLAFEILFSTYKQTARMGKLIF